MDDFNQLCQICLETFNQNSQKKIPKQLPCCKHTICLECLEDIYKRNNNTIICPVCRKTTFQNPNSLPTNSRVFEGFLRCPNCQRDVTKTELFLSFGDNLNLKCSHCQNEDLNLDDFLPSYLLELDTFIKEFCTKGNLIQKIDDKINESLDLIFQEIKVNMILSLREKIINEIKLKLTYDIKGDYNIFQKYLSEIKEKYDYLNSFASDDTNKKFNSIDIINAINYYAQKSDDIRKESNKFLYIEKFISENPLFVLNEKITKNELANFLLKCFDATLSDHNKEIDFLTGIKIFDNEVLKKIEESKSISHLNNNINYYNNNNNNNNINNNINNNYNNNNNNEFININDNIDFDRKDSDVRFTLIPKDNKEFSNLKINKQNDFFINSKKKNDILRLNDVIFENNKEFLNLKRVNTFSFSIEKLKNKMLIKFSSKPKEKIIVNDNENGSSNDDDEFIPLQSKQKPNLFNNQI